MDDTADSVPRIEGATTRLARKLKKRRGHIGLEALLDGIIEFAPGISKKYAAGTDWGQVIQVKDDTGRVKTRPSLMREYHDVLTKQSEPVIRGLKKNRNEPDWIGEVGQRSANPDRFKETKEELIHKQQGVPHPWNKGDIYTRREIDAPNKEGNIERRGVKASDLRNVEGYRRLKLKQISEQDAPRVRQGYSEADLIARDVPEKNRALLRQGTDVTQDPQTRGQIRNAARGIRKKSVQGDLSTEVRNMRDAIAEDTNINRKIVHAIRKERGESGKGGFFREPDKNVIPMNPKASESAMNEQKKLLAKVRGNFDTLKAGELERRKAQAGQIHEMVRKRAHEALVTREHGEGWQTRLTGRKLQQALDKHAKAATDYASSIVSLTPARHDELADLIGAKPEGLAKVRENYHSLLRPDSKAHQRIDNRLIRSGKIFDGTSAFTPTAPAPAAKKGYPTLKKIGIAGALIGGGLLARKLYTDKRDREQQKQLMSSRGRVIQFGKKSINKIVKAIKGAKPPATQISNPVLTPETERLLNKAAGTAAANEAKYGGGKMPGPEAPAGQWAQVEAAQDISPEATKLVESARSRVRDAMMEPGGLEKIQPHDLVGDKIAATLTPETVGKIKSTKKRLYKGAVPARPLRGSRAAKAQGRVESTMVERGDIEGVQKMLKEKGMAGTPEQAKAHMTVMRPRIAAGIRSDRNARRGYKQKTGFDPDTVVDRMKSEMFKAQGDAKKAAAAAAKGIAEARERGQSEIRRITKASEAAKEEALGKQSAVHKQDMDKARTRTWRNTAIGVGAGTILGASLTGNESHQPKQKQFKSAIRSVIRFDSDPRQIRKKSTLGHDIATGTLEGAAVGPLMEPIFAKLQGEKSLPILRGGFRGVLKRMAIGGGLGALTTAATGGLVNTASKKNREMSALGKEIRFSNASRSVVSRDRYQQQIYDKDEDRAIGNYKKSALAGGTLAMMLRGKRTRLGTFLAGAGAGLGAQAATRVLTSTSKDQFGDRSHLAKKIDKLPWQVPLLVAGGIVGRKAWKAGALQMSRKGKTIQFDEEDPYEAGYAARRDEDRNWRKAKSQVGKVTQGVKRSHRLLADVVRAAKGQKNLDSRGRERKREWDKPWVRNAITGTIAVGTLAGFHKVIKSTGPNSALGRAKEMWHRGDFHNAAREKIPGFRKAHDWVRGFKGSATGEAAAATENSGFMHRMLDKVQRAAGRPTAKPVEVLQRDGSVVVHNPGTTGYIEHMRKTTPEAEKDITKAAEETARKQLSRLREIQVSTTIKNSAKGKVIRFRADDHDRLDDFAEEHGKKVRHYRDAHEKWLRLQPGKTQRNRRDATFTETKSGQQLIYRAKIGAALLTGALGARLLGPRMTAAAAASSGAKRAIHTQDVREELKKVVNASSKDPLLTLNAKLDRMLNFEEEAGKKKVERGLLATEAGLTAGLGVYGWMRRRRPLPKGASPELKRIREAAEKHGFTRVVHQDRSANRPPSKGPTLWQRIQTAILNPADKHEHLVEGQMFTPGKRTKAAVFDPEESGRLRSPVMIGENKPLTKAIERSKLDEYKIATRMGIAMPHTTVLRSASGLRRGYVAKANTGSQSKLVVTRKMVAEHDPAHPDLVSYKKFRRLTRKATTDENILAHTLNHHPGYGRWLTEQAIMKPEKFVQQKKINIASEHRVHTIGGESIGITSGRHGLVRGGKAAEREVNKMLSKAKPKLKGAMLSVDVAKDTKGKYHIIETNPGATSGFLTPRNKADIRGPHQLYRVVTGRHSNAASVAAASAAAGGVGYIESVATRDNQRKPRPVPAPKLAPRN